LKVQSANAFQTGIYRLDEASLLERNAVWNPHSTALDYPLHDTDVFRESAAGGFESRRATHFFVGCALREGLVPAIEALPARDVMKDHDAIAGAIGGYVFSDRGYHSGGFMSENSRGRVRTCRDFLEVRAAHPAGMDTDEHFTRPDRWYRNGFKPDVVHTTIDRGAHRTGDWCSFDFGR
jgi:hypothetical protein